MRMKLVIIEDSKTGKGVIQIIEDKKPAQQPIIGFVAFDDADKRDFYVKALIQDGKNGEIIQV